MLRFVTNALGDYIPPLKRWGASTTVGVRRARPADDDAPAGRTPKRARHTDSDSEVTRSLSLSLPLAVPPPPPPPPGLGTLPENVLLRIFSFLSVTPREGEISGRALTQASDAQDLACSCKRFYELYRRNCLKRIIFDYSAAVVVSSTRGGRHERQLARLCAFAGPYVNSLTIGGCYEGYFELLFKTIEDKCPNLVHVDIADSDYEFDFSQELLSLLRSREWKTVRLPMGMRSTHPIPPTPSPSEPMSNFLYELVAADVVRKNQCGLSCPSMGSSGMDMDQKGAEVTGGDDGEDGVEMEEMENEDGEEESDVDISGDEGGSENGEEEVEEDEEETVEVCPDQEEEGDSHSSLTHLVRVGKRYASENVPAHLRSITDLAIPARLPSCSPASIVGLWLSLPRLRTLTLSADLPPNMIELLPYVCPHLVDIRLNLLARVRDDTGVYRSTYNVYYSALFKAYSKTLRHVQLAWFDLDLAFVMELKTDCTHLETVELRDCRKFTPSVCAALGSTLVSVRETALSSPVISMLPTVAPNLHSCDLVLEDIPDADVTSAMIKWADGIGQHAKLRHLVIKGARDDNLNLDWDAALSALILGYHKRRVACGRPALETLRIERVKSFSYQYWEKLLKVVGPSLLTVSAFESTPMTALEFISSISRFCPKVERIRLPCLYDGGEGELYDAISELMLLETKVPYVCVSALRKYTDFVFTFLRRGGLEWVADEQE